MNPTDQFQTDDSSRSFRINRRDVLKASTLGIGVIGFGVPAFSGSALANHVAGHPASQFNLYGIDHFSTPNKLVKIDSPDLVPGAGTITVSSIDLSTDVNVNTLAAHPFEESGVRYFYSTDLNTNKAFKVHPADGTVTHFGSANSVLGGVAGSAIIVDDSDQAHWYGITHAGASPASTLFEIDLTDGTTDEKGELHTVEDGVSTPVVATHLGLGVNFLTDELWGVIGDPDEPTNSQVFRVIDVDTGEIEIVDADAMTGGRSVGAALGPCANVMYAVRNGNSLFGYDVSSKDEYTYGSLEYESGELDFDSLTVPYGYVCEENECVTCEDEEMLVKYEFECVETEVVDDEEVCVRWDFVPEGETDENISYTEGSFNSKEGTDFEPMDVTFDTEYCDLYVLVKSGQEFEVQSFEDIDGSVTVETANDEKYAISFVAFYCTMEAAEEARDSFPSKGRGGGR